MNNCKKCGYYSDGECNICGMGISGEDTFCRLCKDNPSCYYKQLDKLKTKKDKYYQQTLDDEIQINELLQTLQEIKAIAETPKPFKDFSVTKTATEIEYDYAVICNELELRLHKVLELITKAEEE